MKKKTSGGRKGFLKGHKENIRRKKGKSKNATPAIIEKIDAPVIKSKKIEETVPHLQSPASRAKLLVDSYLDV